MISAGLFPLTADEETLRRTLEEKRKSGASSVNPREEQMRLKEKTPMITQTLLDAQRAAMTKDGIGPDRLSAERAATGSDGDNAMEQPADSDAKGPEAEWRTFSKPSGAMAQKVAAFEKSSTGFKLAPEQLSACRWFAEAMDVALQEEEKQTPLRNRAQHACLLIGAGGTGKTTTLFGTHAGCLLSFFPGQTRRRRANMISTFSHSQSDAISNDVYRARTCHTACSYRVASLRNKQVSAEALQRERRQMQAKHLWYNVDIRWSDLKDKLEVLAPTGLTREDIWRHLFLTKQRKNPYEEGCYTGEDVEDVKQNWEAKKHYFEQYKKDVPRPPCIDLDRAILGFNIDNTAAFQAIEDSKALHARRWQTKEGTYRIKRRALPDVRDAPLQDDNAAASCSDGKPRWRCWDGDYAMGYQHHP